jgi:DNA polymerase type B, organellar and viral
MKKITLDTKSSGKLKTSYRGIRVVRLVFNSDENLSNDDVEAYVEKYSKTYQQKGINGMMSVACLYPFGWRSGRMFIVGQDVDVYNPNNWYKGEDVDFDDTCRRFCIFVIGASKPEGGCGEFNDCLFQCLRQAYGGNEDEMPAAINRPKKLKKLLGVERCAQVPLDSLPTLEDVLKNCSINVTGDYTYISSKQTPLNVNLKLVNEHFTLLNNENRTFTAHVNFKPVKRGNVIAYSTFPSYRIYDGKAHIEVTADKIKEMKAAHNFLMIKADATTSKAPFVQVVKPLKDARDAFLEKADRLKELTNGKVNLFKYPTIAICAQDIFRFMSKIAKVPEVINAVESSIIDKAFAGGLTYAEKGYKGLGVCYDMNSMYPYFMTDKRLQFSMGAGQPVTLSDSEFASACAEKYFKYGIYRCIVHKSGDINVDKFFKLNRDNHYTHFDLILAVELGLKVQLIQDGQFNCYTYDKGNLVQSSKLFGEFVNYFYDLKSQYKPAKEILNALWGSLCERTRNELYLKDDQEFKLHDDLQITSICPAKDGTFKISYRRHDSLFKTNWARIGPFLTSYARMKLVRLVKPYASNIVRMHTDSITLNEDIPVLLTLNKDIGSFKQEYKQQIEIVHVNRVIKL